MSSYVMFEINPIAYKSLMAILEATIVDYSVQISNPESVATFEAMVSLYKKLDKEAKEVTP